MSIEKMEFVNIAGPVNALDAVIFKLSECGCFHIETASKLSGRERKVQSGSGIKEENPYTAVLKELDDISAMSGVKYESTDFSELQDSDTARLEREVRTLKKVLEALSDKRKKSGAKLNACQRAIDQVNHLKGLDVDFQQIFSCEYVKVRFGRLPADSYEKLPYYDDKNFFFNKFSEESDYCWGVYFTPMSCADETDEIFNSLYFERVRIADFVHGNSEDAIAELNKMYEESKAETETLDNDIRSLAENKKAEFNKIFSFYKSRHFNFDLRMKAAVSNGKFSVIGFVPESDSERFMELFKELSEVSVVMQPADPGGKLKPPIKMKNNRFTKPFSMFIEMYGLPSYGGINPTAFVAVTYTLLFGIMFGDFGQGIVVAILGALLWKYKKFALGPIMTRIGISGAVFGLLYGSVFGFEELLDPVYESLGISFLPFKIMDNVTTILVTAIAIGVVIMLISILTNIVIGIKNRSFEDALFGNNGIAGLVFYGSILGGAVGTLLGAKIFNPVYVICLIILPLIMMFLREPLACMVKGRKFELESTVGDFIASNFFEVFEFLLGYATNTLSFVRIGGFVLSHASMMLVVMALSRSVSAGASPVVVILGNVFVMVIEGFLVGIQTLRLEFYEVFSRFYSGDGVPFTPVSINYDETVE